MLGHGGMREPGLLPIVPRPFLMAMSDAAMAMPVYRHRGRILDALDEHRAVVVESPTGSGKTTQIPRLLYEHGYGRTARIGITQPRRIAAVSVCRYLQRQMAAADGVPEDLVAYKMRFEDTTTRSCAIKIMTDGILLQEIKLDSDLREYQVVVVDEAHERSLNIDFALGLLKQVLERRDDLRVVVSSATINAEAFSAYFGGCPIVRVDARAFPVDVHYRPIHPESDPDATRAAIGDIVAEIDRTGEPGDVLIFLSGEREIRECIAALRSLPVRRPLAPLPLFARLSGDEQQRVFDDYPGRRKVVAATNIAETSLTIDGIVWVIDPGRAKLNAYDPRTFTASLTETLISRASCSQRTGRAGRTRPGVCYRLYDRRSFDDRPAFTAEEILRTDLTEVVLRMADLGIDDFENFDFISTPGRRHIRAAVDSLRWLGALDDGRRLTGVGEQMVLFPILPRLARIIVEAVHRYPTVIDEAITGAAFLSTPSPFLYPLGEEEQARGAHQAFHHRLGDFAGFLDLLRKFEDAGDREGFCRRHFLDDRVLGEVSNIKRQLAQIVSDMGVPLSGGGPLHDYLCAVSRGLIQYVCVNTGRGTYRSLSAERIHIHPGSSMYREDARFIVAGEIVRTSRLYARSVSPLRAAMLARIDPRLAEALVPEPRARPRSGRGRPHGDGVRTARTRRGSAALQLAGVTLPLTPGKGSRRYAILEWSAVRHRRVELAGANRRDLGDVRGVIRESGGELMRGAPLASILQALPHLRIDEGVLRTWPERRFDPRADRTPLLAAAELALRVVPRGAGSRRLGFLSLAADGTGGLRLQPRRGWRHAVEETLASLQSLPGGGQPLQARLRELLERTSER